MQCLQSFRFRFLHGHVLSRLQSLLVLEQAAGMPKVVKCVCTAGVNCLKLIWNSRMVRSRLCENVVLSCLTNGMFNRVLQLAVLVMCIHARMTSSSKREGRDVEREKHGIITNVSICMVLVFVEFYQCIPLSLTLTLVQGHVA